MTFKKIKVGETVSIIAKVYDAFDLVNEEIIWKPRFSEETVASISESGEITTNEVGRYYFCAHLATDDSIYECGGIDIVAYCESRYTFESKNKTYYDIYYEDINLTSGIDFCPGTYIVHIDSVQNEQIPYFIAVNSYSYIYEKNDILSRQENGQDREFIFEDGFTLSVDYGVYSVTLIKK